MAGRAAFRTTMTDMRDYLSLDVQLNRGDRIFHRRLGVPAVVAKPSGRRSVTVHAFGLPELESVWRRVDVLVVPRPIRPVVKLIGLAPAEADPGAPALCGHSGIRLATACGLGGDWAALGRVFSLANALSTPRTRWTRRELRKGVIAALGHDTQEAVVLGADIGEALGAGGWFEPVRVAHPAGIKRSIEVTVVPHPSGRCRLWNDPEKRRGARRILGAIARRSISCPPGVELATWARIQDAALQLEVAGVHAGIAVGALPVASDRLQWAARVLGAPRR